MVWIISCPKYLSRITIRNDFSLWLPKIGSKLWNSRFSINKNVVSRLFAPLNATASSRSDSVGSDINLWLDDGIPGALFYRTMRNTSGSIILKVILWTSKIQSVWIKILRCGFQQPILLPIWKRTFLEIRKLMKYVICIF